MIFILKDIIGVWVEWVGDNLRVRKKYTFCLESIELEPRATFRWFFSCCIQLHSSPEFSRFLTSPDNRADCCPCTDCQVERGATLSRRFSARRPHPAPASPPPAPRPRANPFISSFQFTNPPPRARVTCRPRLLLPGYLRARRLDKSAPLGETCKACDSI